MDRKKEFGASASWPLSAALIALAYLAISVAWIVVSDRALHALVRDPEAEARIQTYKGLGFMVATAIGLFMLVSAVLRGRERASRALERARERYELAIGGTNDGIWDWNILTGKIFWSARLEELLGFGPDEFQPDIVTWEERLHPEEHERTKAALKAHLETGSPYDVEYRLRLKDGTYRWFRARGKAIRDGAGKPVRMAGSLTDIQQRVEATERLRASEERGRSTFENAAVGISHVGLDGSLIAVNDRLCHMLGYTRGELLARTFASVTHPDDVAENLRLFQETVESDRETFSMEKRYIRADGSVLWAHLSAALVRDGRGKPERFISVVQDITDRKRAEQELRESRAVLEQAQEVGRIGSWISDGTTEGRVEWSAEVCRIFGVERGAFDGRAETFYGMIHPEDRERTAEAIRAAIAGERAYDFDHRIIRPDGEVRWVHEQARIERDGVGGAGGVVRMVGVTQDITERLVAERFDSEQRRVLEIMAAGAPLDRTIDAIVRLIEQQSNPAIGSVLRLDELGRMWTLGAPSLPAEYCKAINGLSIGPGVGCCGTAMHSKRRVVVTDIATDPLWVPYKEYALKHGLRACWSEPIIGTDGTVLGSFAMYFKEVRGPNERDLTVIATAAHLAGIAMERARIEESRNRSEATNRALLAANPDMMFRMDREGRYLGYHAPDPGRLMVPPEAFVGRLMEEVLPVERAVQCRENLERLFATGRSQLYDYEVVRPDGRNRRWEVRIVQGMEGEALLLLRDVTEQREAEQRVRESEERLRLLVQNTPLGVVYFDTEFRVTGWNPGAARLFGHTEQEAIGRHASFLVPESERRRVSEVWRGLLSDGGGARSANQNVRKDGELVFCEWYNCPLADHSGKVIGVASVVEDVTERRLTQQRQDFMMAELDHRVKNNLSAVISLAEQTGRGSGTYREFLDKFMGRIRAMSRMHSVLARSRWQGADLRTLVTQTVEAFGSGSAGRASVEGQSVMLGARAAQAMAMALNELATNAVKYGALSAAGGLVRVSWTADGEGASRTLHVRWEERGGPEVHPPEVRGFGSQLIEGAIAYELRGKVVVEFEAGGVVCTMVVPLGGDTEETFRPESATRSVERP